MSQRIAFVVVRECGGKNYGFSKWHNSEDDAFVEAERLCKSERTKFYVLKLVGVCQVDEVPVKTDRWK